MAEQLGLTPRQTQVYALRFEGRTQAEVAAMLNISQPRVSTIEKQARKRNARLPALTDGRRHRTTNLSAYADSPIADVLGLN